MWNLYATICKLCISVFIVIKLRSWPKNLSIYWLTMMNYVFRCNSEEKLIPQIFLLLMRIRKKKRKIRVNASWAISIKMGQKNAFPSFLHVKMYVNILLNIPLLGFCPKIAYWLPGDNDLVVRAITWKNSISRVI